MINWYPGHMAKTRRLILDNIKLVDVIVELADARLPISSRNPLLDEMIGDRPRLLILMKEDLADERQTKLWLKYYREAQIFALAVNAGINAKGIRNSVFMNVEKAGYSVLKKRENKGIINKSLRTMVLGIPNVGKSTLINVLAGKDAAATGDRPGVTRGKQWIRLEKNIELLDMPGILWPKIDDPQVGYKLAVTGAIGENAFDVQELATWLIEWLRNQKQGCLTERYKVSENLDTREILVEICKKRGYLRQGGIVEPEKAAVTILEEFRKGKLGRYTMDDLRNVSYEE